MQSFVLHDGDVVPTVSRPQKTPADEAGMIGVSPVGVREPLPEFGVLSFPFLIFAKCTMLTNMASLFSIEAQGCIAWFNVPSLKLRWTELISDNGHAGPHGGPPSSRRRADGRRPAGRAREGQGSLTI